MGGIGSHQRRDLGGTGLEGWLFRQSKGGKKTDLSCRGVIFRTRSERCSERSDVVLGTPEIFSRPLAGRQVLQLLFPHHPVSRNVFL